MIYYILCKLCIVLYNVLRKKTIEQKMATNIIVGFEDIKVKLLPFSYRSISPRANSLHIISIRSKPPPRRLLRQAR
jgi:hypothetical protein